MSSPKLNPSAESILADLMEGNRRFREGRSTHHVYAPEAIAHLAIHQKPRAAIVACSDGRVGPETIFDQPLGTLFVSRVPGNVASDGSKWMLDLAVEDLKVPIVIVMGHTLCLAVGQIVAGNTMGPGGMLRIGIATAVMKARSRRPDDVYRAAIIENALQATEHLMQESHAIREAISAGTTSIVTMIYNTETGLAEVVGRD